MYCYLFTCTFTEVQNKTKHSPVNTADTTQTVCTVLDWSLASIIAHTSAPFVAAIRLTLHPISSSVLARLKVVHFGDTVSTVVRSCVSSSLELLE